METLMIGSIDLCGPGYLARVTGDGGYNGGVTGSDAKFNLSGGARRVYASNGAATRNLVVECSANDGDNAQDTRDALIAEVLKANNFPQTGTAITYVEEPSGGNTDTWKVLWGTWSWDYSLFHSGKYLVSIGLHLSKS